MESHGESEHLEGRNPTPRQLEHLRKDLFYDGPEPKDACEASQIIASLHSDPKTLARQTYQARISEGPSWIAWEKWQSIPRKEYNRNQWLKWWNETCELADLAGQKDCTPALMPFTLSGSRFSTIENIFDEVREILSLPTGAKISVEISVSNKSEAIEAQKSLKATCIELRYLEDDCSHILSLVRRSMADDPEIEEIHSSNLGERPKPYVRKSKEDYRLMKRSIISSYTNARASLKTLIQQIDELLRKIQTEYK